MYPEWFEQMWTGYPKRPGNSKAAAYRQCQARIKQGSTPDDLLAGTRRYKAYTDATGTTGTTYTKMAQTFYGRDMHYSEEWELPNEPNQNNTGTGQYLSAAERVAAANGIAGTQSQNCQVMGNDGSDVRGQVDAGLWDDGSRGFLEQAPLPI